MGNQTKCNKRRVLCIRVVLIEKKGWNWKVPFGLQSRAKWIFNFTAPNSILARFPHELRNSKKISFTEQRGGRIASQNQVLMKRNLIEFFIMIVQVLFFFFSTLPFFIKNLSISFITGFSTVPFFMDGSRLSISFFLIGDLLNFNPSRFQTKFSFILY